MKKHKHKWGKWRVNDDLSGAVRECQSCPFDETIGVKTITRILNAYERTPKYMNIGTATWVQGGFCKKVDIDSINVDITLPLYIRKGRK